MSGQFGKGLISLKLGRKKKKEGPVANGDSSRYVTSRAIRRVDTDKKEVLSLVLQCMMQLG